MSRTIPAFAVLIWLVTPSWAGTPISPAEIDALLRAAVAIDSPDALKLPGFEFQKLGGRDSYYPRFMVYEAIWAGAPGGSVNIGFYALDPLTGDVWNGVMCEEFKSSRLAEVQRQVRAHIGLPWRQYQNLKTTGPQCE
jgi:hypothetical protein